MNGLGAAKSFPEVLLELGEASPDVFVVSQDVGPVGAFAQKFPERALDVGITEQNLVGVAAGLAARGKLDFVYAMAPFVTMRAFEQVRTDLAYNEKNVKIFAIFGDLLAGPWGSTHHAIEDFALMRAIPGMTVLAPADPHETESCLRAAAELKGPAYIRMGGFMPVHEEAYAFQIGRAISLRDGSDATIVATGTMVRQAIEAHNRLKERGVQAGVLDMHTIKPLAAGGREVVRERIGRVFEDAPGGNGGPRAQTARGPTSSRLRQRSAYWKRVAVRARAMTMRWISLVPSKIWKILASRTHFSTGNSRM